MGRYWYKNNTLTDNNAFEAIVRHPYAPDKYILLVGALDIQSLQKITTTGNLFTAWYDCLVFSTPRTIVGKLDDMQNTTSKQTPLNKKSQTPTSKSQKNSKSQNSKSQTKSKTKPAPAPTVNPEQPSTSP